MRLSHSLDNYQLTGKTCWHQTYKDADRTAYQPMLAARSTLLLILTNLKKGGTVVLTITYTAHWYSNDHIVKTMTMGIYASKRLDSLGPLCS